MICVNESKLYGTTRVFYSPQPLLLLFSSVRPSHLDRSATLGTFLPSDGCCRRQGNKAHLCRSLCYSAPVMARQADESQLESSEIIDREQWLWLYLMWPLPPQPTPPQLKFLRLCSLLWLYARNFSARLNSHRNAWIVLQIRSKWPRGRRADAKRVDLFQL